MSQIDILCQTNTQKRWARLFSLMVCGLFLLTGFNVYGANTDPIIMDQDGIWAERDFKKFTKGEKLTVIINIDKVLVLRDIKELNKIRRKAELPEYPTNLNEYQGKSDEINWAIHICWINTTHESMEKVISYYFVAENKVQDRTISPPPIFKGDIKIEKDVHFLAISEEKKKEEPLFGKIEFDFKFAEAGKKYTASIKRYSTIDDKLKQTNAYKIFTMDFFTYHRFKLGHHAGLFFPFSNYNTFGLSYNNTSVEKDQKAFVDVGTNWEPKVIFFISFYPGFEPEKKAEFQKAGGRISFNIGTELSSAIFKKLYFGIGYSFNYCSISIFYCYEKKDVLAEGFQDKTVIENPNITAVPLAKEDDLRLGLVVSFPINIATNLLGKLLGI